LADQLIKEYVEGGSWFQSAGQGRPVRVLCDA